MNTKDVLREPQVVSYKNDSYATYAVNKQTLLYHGLELWCNLLNNRISRTVHLVNETPNYIFFNAVTPLTSKAFSQEFLSNRRGVNKRGNATKTFVKYLNRRYRVLYTRDMFDVVDNAKPNADALIVNKSEQYYLKLRVKALEENIENNVLHIDYNYDPLANPDVPQQPMQSKGQILSHYVTTYPYEQLGKFTVLYQLISLWMLLHDKKMSDTVRGFQQDSRYIYFGMTNIPHSDSWKFSHPNHFSDVDYFLLGGSGDGLTMKKFINWIRNSTLESVQKQLRQKNSGFNISRV